MKSSVHTVPQPIVAKAITSHYRIGSVFEINCVYISTEFLESKSDELFENVPDLKETFVIQSKIGEGKTSLSMGVLETV